MFKHKWAAIIYGRSYHLDFRFITIPQDFTSESKKWASKYILATFSHANKLSDHPRWSLFKNESHCIIGVTCMVRDLLVGIDHQVIEILSKDNRGRPLYVFVGYVTQLDRRKQLSDFPPYTNKYLQPFQNLYQYILEVWWIEEYYKNSKKPILTQYQTLNFHNQNNSTLDVLALTKQINHQAKYPEQTYLWENTLEQKEKLWITSAICHQPISICLGDQSMTNIINRASPFLNQTVISDSAQIVEGCAIKKIKNSCQKVATPLQNSPQDSLSEIVTKKVKEDIEVTLQHAKIVTNKSRDLWHKVSERQPNTSEENKLDGKLNQENDFGFKTKSQKQLKQKRDWF